MPHAPLPGTKAGNGRVYTGTELVMGGGGGHGHVIQALLGIAKTLPKRSLRPI